MHLELEPPDSLQDQVPGYLHAEFHGFVRSPRRPPQHAEIRLRPLTTDLYYERIRLRQVRSTGGFCHY